MHAETDVIETVADIISAHRRGTTSPEDTIARSYRRIRAHADPAAFISLRDEQEAIAEARALGPPASGEGASRAKPYD